MLSGTLFAERAMAQLLIFVANFFVFVLLVGGALRLHLMFLICHLGLFGLVVSILQCFGLSDLVHVPIGLLYCPTPLRVAFDQRLEQLIIPVHCIPFVYPAGRQSLHARYLCAVDRLVSRPRRLKRSQIMLPTTCLLCQRKNSQLANTCEHF